MHLPSIKTSIKYYVYTCNAPLSIIWIFDCVFLHLKCTSYRLCAGRHIIFYTWNIPLIPEWMLASSIKKSLILNKHANILIDINQSIRLISECFTDNQILSLLKWTKVVEWIYSKNWARKKRFLNAKNTWIIDSYQKNYLIVRNK